MRNELSVTIPKNEIADFCQRNHIQKLSLFGSVLREDFGADSDVDVLVEFEPDQVVGFLGLVRMELELSEILGRKADLRTVAELSRYFQQRVIETAVMQYERI